MPPHTRLIVSTSGRAYCEPLMRNARLILLGVYVGSAGLVAEPINALAQRKRFGEIFFQKRQYHFEHGVINFVSPNETEPVVNLLVTTTVNQYNISIQRQLANGLMAEIGYAGSSSHKLLTWVDQNPFSPQPGMRLLNQQLLASNPSADPSTP